MIKPLLPIISSANCASTPSMSELNIELANSSVAGGSGGSRPSLPESGSLIRSGKILSIPPCSRSINSSRSLRVRSLNLHNWSLMHSSSTPLSLRACALVSLKRSRSVNSSHTDCPNGKSCGSTIQRDSISTKAPIDLKNEVRASWFPMHSTNGKVMGSTFIICIIKS